MKRILLYSVYLAFTIPCIARLVPYVASLDQADAVAIVTVTSYEQSYHDGLIHESATLTVDTAIQGIKVGEHFKESFGVPNPPAKMVDGKYSATLALQSDGLSFSIAERYVVLLKKKGGSWSILRASRIVDGSVTDGYFEDFAGSQDVTISTAVALLKAHRKSKEPNQASEPTAPSGRGSS